MTSAQMPIRLWIERLGWRGEGIAATETGRVFVPYALPGDVVDADLDRDRGTAIALIEASPDRIEPICPYFTSCGGCAVQAWDEKPYAAWKRGLLTDALRRAGVAAEVGPLVDAHGVGRRRATFHARVDPAGGVAVGFMRARAHEIIAIDSCPILDPALAGALPAARAIAEALAKSARKGRFSLDIVATATASGLDLDFRGYGPLAEADNTRLCKAAMAHDLARLSNHGTIVLERRRPVVRMGRASVELPPGAFLQATEAGEAALAARVYDALVGAKRIADLFSGLGTFALRLAETAEVSAYDTEAPAIAALDHAAKATPGTHPVRTEVRDLFRRPIAPEELNAFDAIVLDPPRAGAEGQMQLIASSRVERVVSVACDAQTFVRDAAILSQAGFTIDRVEPIDQFRYSAHLEIVAVFRRAPAKRKRRLFG